MTRQDSPGGPHLRRERTHDPDFASQVRSTPRTQGDVTLRGLHPEAGGRGAIVGDRGSVFMTRDFGASATRVETGEVRDIFAVDALGEEHARRDRDPAQRVPSALTRTHPPLASRRGRHQITGAVEVLNEPRTRHRNLPPALTGALAHFGLATLLTVLEMERRSGVLQLRGRGPERSARLGLRHGQVVHVEIQGSSLRGPDGVIALLGWVDGSSIFRVGEVDDTDEVSLPTSMLLLEAARRADELAA